MEQGAERGPARVKFASHLFHAMARSAAARDGWMGAAAPSHRRIALIQSAPTNNFVSISKCAADASLQLQTEEREKRALLVSHPSVRLYGCCTLFRPIYIAKQLVWRRPHWKIYVDARCLLFGRRIVLYSLTRDHFCTGVFVLSLTFIRVDSSYCWISYYYFG
jgi:hypothetical protein